MTGQNNDDGSSERAFAVLMIVLSVIIFFAILKSERSEPNEPNDDRSQQQ